MHALCDSSKKLFHERQPRGDLSDRASVGGGDDADGHRLVGVRSFGLDDELVGQAFAVEVPGQLTERLLRRHRQRDDDCPVRQWSACGLAGGMRDLRDLNPAGQIASDGDVVDQCYRKMFDRRCNARSIIGEVDRRGR